MVDDYDGHDDHRHDGDPDNDDDDVVRRDQQPVHVQGGDGKGDRGEGERKKGGTSKPDSGVVVIPCVLCITHPQTIF